MIPISQVLHGFANEIILMWKKTWIYHSKNKCNGWLWIVVMVIKIHKKLFRALLVWFKYLECTWTCKSDYCISCFCNKTEIITYKHETKSWTQKPETFYSSVFLSMISFHYSYWYSHYREGPYHLIISKYYSLIYLIDEYF